MSKTQDAHSHMSSAEILGETKSVLEAVSRVMIARAWMIGGLVALAGLAWGRGPRFGASALAGTIVASVNLLLMTRNAGRAAACPTSAAEGLRMAFTRSLLLRYGAFLLVLAAIGSVYPFDVTALALGLLSAQAAALSLKVRRWKKSASTP